jgi:hypothetical protein
VPLDQGPEMVELIGGVDIRRSWDFFDVIHDLHRGLSPSPQCSPSGVARCCAETCSATGDARAPRNRRCWREMGDDLARPSARTATIPRAHRWRDGGWIVVAFFNSAGTFGRVQSLRHFPWSPEYSFAGASLADRFTCSQRSGDGDKIDLTVASIGLERFPQQPYARLRSGP